MSAERLSPVAPRTDSAHDARQDPSWWRLRRDVNRLQGMQLSDGSIDLAQHDARSVRDDVAAIVRSIELLSRFFPHQQDYLSMVVSDFERWAANGLAQPDFSASLAAFRPDQQRDDQLEHLAVFPMYKQNGSPDPVLEALLIGVSWPDWLAELERSRYPNPSYVPGMLLDYTRGYDSACAVLFPEMVSARAECEGNFGIIFCDREAERFRAEAGRAVELLGIELPPEGTALFESPRISQEAFQLWDLVHDHTHHHGYLPFNTFVSRQRAPYWMYTLEELRCDLTAFRDAIELERSGLPIARNAQIAIVLDRLLRFPLARDNVRDYDGLVGQLLFGFLYRSGCLRWHDDRLQVVWDALPEAMDELHDDVEALYRDGVITSRLSHWNRGHELIARYVPPAVLSRWQRSVPTMTDDPKSWTVAVLSDEFPHSLFYVALRRRMAAG